ncbi:MAG: hypothetical protein ACYTF1_18440 [Planctomycetota bacterium]
MWSTRYVYTNPVLSSYPIFKGYISLRTLVASVCALLLLTFSMSGCKKEDEVSVDVEMPVLIGKARAPNIAIYSNPYAHTITPRELEPQVIIVVWSDGQVIWSDDTLYGGRPYFMGRIASVTLSEFIKELTNRGLFKDSTRNDDYISLDSDHLVIAICDGSNRVMMSSDHELYETHPDVIGTAEGIMTLEGRSREWVRDKQPRYYKRFRKLWADIREASTKLIPSEGQPAGDIHFKWGLLPDHKELTD